MYQDGKGTTFAWFNTEDDMINFVDENRVHVIEGIRIVKYDRIMWSNRCLLMNNRKGDYNAKLINT